MRCTRCQYGDTRCDDGDGSGDPTDGPCLTTHYDPVSMIDFRDVCDDNCPMVVNPDQDNADDDTCGDACDTAPMDATSGC